MAEIVAAIACGHAPGMGTRPDPDPAGQKERVYAFYKATRARLAATNPTAAILVSDEHIQNFFFNNWPSLCIAFPEEMEGPIERWMPIPRATVRGYPEFGQFLAQAIAAWPRPDRFVVIGVGGISHWIGIKRMGEINAQWDRWFLDQVCQGNMDAILSLTPAEVERDAGNGGEEIRNWITVMAAAGCRPGELMGYEDVADWVCGAGVVFWDLTRNGNGTAH
jgi:hypothetical protein